MNEYCHDTSANSFVHTLIPDYLAQKFPFHVVAIGYFDVGDRHYTVRDSLNNYLLLISVGGQGKITWKNRTEILTPGTAVLIDCNILQDYRTFSSDRWQYWFLHFQTLSIEGYRSMFLDQLTPITLSSSERTQQLLRDLYNSTFQSGVFAYSQQSNMISELLTEMSVSLSDSERWKSRFGRVDIQELAQFIRDNYSQPLHIEDFTKRINLSKHHLIRLFERQIGMTPYRYLHMCRINKAQVLLRSTDMTVNQIAYSVGYSDPAIFIRHFKSFSNTTPSLYRSQSLSYPAGNDGSPADTVPAETDP